jgi:protein-S-isoprenylcysteine O-methyltransferase Ste14
MKAYYNLPGMHKYLKDNIYVGLQFLLIIIFFITPGFDSTFTTLLKYPGLILIIGGSIVVLTSMLQLKSNLTAYPTPKETAFLYTGGLYGVVRHPIYSGVVILFLGLSFVSASFIKLFITLILMILFHFKSEYEEVQLSQKFDEYKQYKTRTGKFFPN